MKKQRHPIYLLADSQLLFWKYQGSLFLSALPVLIEVDSSKAAYIGASNGDAPEFYSIFEAAMENIGMTHCRMIHSSFSREDRAFVEKADLILLAGGDVVRGWEVFESVGLPQLIRQRYDDGAFLIGVSAGAVQLGMYGRRREGEGQDVLFDTFQLVPYLIDVHDEKNEWEMLRNSVGLSADQTKGLGIVSGAGFLYHPDHSLEPIRYPLYEFSNMDGTVSQTLLLPKTE